MPIFKSFELFADLPFPIVVRNDQLRLVYANRAADRILGLTPEVIAGKPELRELIPEEQAAEVNRTVKKVLDTGEEIVFEQEFNRLGIDRLMSVHGSRFTSEDGRTFVLLAFHDIRKTREAELQLQEQKQKLSEEKERHRLLMYGTLHSLPSPIIIMRQDLTVINCNNAFGRLFDCDPTRITGTPVEEIKGFAASAALDVIKQALQTGEETEEFHLKNMVGDNDDRVFTVKAAPLLGVSHIDKAAILIARDITRLNTLEERLLLQDCYEKMIGRSEPMKGLFRTLKQLSQVDSTVLVLGESGVGKELVANAIHEAGPRSDGPFISVNCSALSENLLESELFGHVRGSFSGAVRDRVGRFEAADGGTIFLDEIGEASLSIQVKLLRFLETKQFERVGQSLTRKTDVRIVAATNADLKGMVASGEFRKDLFYRLSVITVTVPSLRERDSDICLLAETFVRQFASEFDKKVWHLDDEVIRIFMSYSWPGNVRELRHTMEYAVLMCDQTTIMPEHLPENFRKGETQEEAPQSARTTNETALNADEIRDALEKSYWKKTAAAKRLGIHRSTLYRLMDRYNLHPEH